ncbi:5-oxoprolinase subunit PxpA [Leeia sp. TBRC 13508]|uniref:5-oxoprolinase subunit A n=1 Tax=Leeia speluncae TaxID=2884804 RepID=A0ABS8D4E4_9NEIS|nr:5-oxoprolinase subunit PxpA [Leeia speluncae]MCB6183067.1 5-oxoprolinase subunit PxpA [Leeia speluncae]
MKHPRIDLNCDMGEGFGMWTIGDGVDEEIMPMISSANIATGFHAGDPNIMHRIVRLAKTHGVRIGAHPGFRDLVGFGRRRIMAPADELVNDMIYQLGALREFARLNGLRMQHFKPHGALYMHVAVDEELSRAMIRALQQLEPTLLLMVMDSSITYQVAKEMGQPVVREFYADREYDKSGSIVFTRRVGRLDPQQVAQKVLKACVDGVVRTIEGEEIEIGFDSVCIHSDTPGALDIVKTTRALLDETGVQITPCSEFIH